VVEAELQEWRRREAVLRGVVPAPDPPQAPGDLGPRAVRRRPPRRAEGLRRHPD
jgi:hypothetical protein